ncbi:hypothetical protein BDF19DRAFT_215958 [Syncephalis fuscata]|nr:hypothetical protein BDF19DRAFT_215958 [Syncephalis fuscata]
MYLRHHIIGAIMLLASVCMASISNDQSIDNSSRQSHGSSRFHVSVKIIGGQTAQKAEFPFAATLFFLSGKEACSASIISNRHLLTAAHCTMEDAKVVSALHNRIADNKHSMIDNSVNITVSGHLPDAWNQKHVDRTFKTILV